MEKIAVFVNDAEHALHIIQPMLKGAAPAHWIIVASAPTLTRHIGRWVSHAARQQWLERWSAELFGRLEPNLRSVAGSSVNVTVAQSPGPGQPDVGSFVKEREKEFVLFESMIPEYVKHGRSFSRW